jgi:hypothetical protein
MPVHHLAGHEIEVSWSVEVSKEISLLKEILFVVT